MKHEDSFEPHSEISGSAGSDGADAERSLSSGDKLREAREARGLSVVEVASRLMVVPKVIESLERTERPPGMDERRTRLLAKTYARYFGIPETPIVEGFPISATGGPAASLPSDRMSHTRLLPVAVMNTIIAILILLLIAGAAGAWWFLRTPASVSETASVSDRVVAVNTAQESLFADRSNQRVESTAIDLELVAQRSAWIEIRGADGTIFRSRTMAKGEAYHPRVGAGWSVTARDAGAFEWQVDGRVIGQLGEDSLAIYSASVDDAAALAEAELNPEVASASNSLASR